jgi:hypothetical protein
MDQSQWFAKAANSVRATRSTGNPLNLKVRQGRLELRRNFFSARVVSSWNDIPNSTGRTAESENFQKRYIQLSRPVEHKYKPSTSRTKMFPKRPYLGHGGGGTTVLAK